MKPDLSPTDKTAATLPEIFRWATRRPRLVLALGLLAIAACAAFLPSLRIDPNAESFLPDGHSALRYREKVEQIFGLADPMVIAVTDSRPGDVFNPEALGLVQWLTDEVYALPDIDPERIVSLATEDNIFGTEAGMVVEPFFAQPPKTQAAADAVREAVMDFPLYVGSLVSRDASTTLVVAEPLDETQAPQIYKALLDIADRAPAPAGVSLHVAGDGAVSGYLVTYINADARRLVPLSVAVITLLCFIAFRTTQGLVLPTIVIVAAAAAAVGLMSAFGYPVYVITTSLPILLVGIAVADSLHLLSEYYENRARYPQATQRQLIHGALSRMWRPVLLTTLTSMIGFLGVYASSYMPPMQSFGLFAMVGLGVAGVYSLFVVPAAQSFFNPKPSPAFRASGDSAKDDAFSSFMSAIGTWVLNKPATVLAIGAAVSAAGLYGALELEVNESWVSNFRKSEPIYRANEAINAAMDGTSNLDIVIETPNKEDLFKPENLRRIEALQNYVETLPHVGGATSIADYIKQMHQAMNADDPVFYRIPDDPQLVSQYFLVYSASGDPTDFEEEIDYDYRLALVRARLDSGAYQDTKQVVAPLQAYIDEHFDNAEIAASLTGRVYVDYEWIENLVGSHIRGVAFALVLVWMVATASFRSLYGGALATLPVLLSTLSVYAVMGLLGINLAVGTTMTAAIALGIGIDFSIHTLDRIKLLVAGEGLPPREALARLYPSTGRALLFNFLAVFLGFGLLGFSYVPPLSKLGTLVAFAVLVSFVSSMTVLPALLKLLRPRFLGFPPMSRQRPTPDGQEARAFAEQ